MSRREASVEMVDAKDIIEGDYVDVNDCGHVVEARTVDSDVGRQVELVFHNGRRRYFKPSDRLAVERY